VLTWSSPAAAAEPRGLASRSTTARPDGADGWARRKLIIERLRSSSAVVDGAVDAQKDDVPFD
jgi:hypothetical protein